MLSSSNPKSVFWLLTSALALMTVVNIAFLGTLIHVFDKLVPPPRIYCTSPTPTLFTELTNAPPLCA